MTKPLRAWAVHDNGDGEGNPSGCGFYRIVMPFNELKRNGHDVACKCGRPPDPPSWPLIVGQRFDKPEVLREWRRFRAHSRLVYEIDDDIWNVALTNWDAWKTYSRDHHQDAVETAMAIADIVTVTTEPLAQIVRKYNPEVRIIPNFIPEALLTWPRPVIRETRQSRRNGKVVIGWRGGSSHALDMQVIAAPVRHVLREHKHARLHITGTDFRDTIGVPADFTPWVQIDSGLDYYRAIRHFDFGLAPLSGLEFDVSKSNLAALEYAALGIPCIATDLEPYRDFIEDGVTGYLIRRKRDWAKRIAELVNDHAARQEMGAAARRKAAAWTIEGNWQRWLAAPTRRGLSVVSRTLAIRICPGNG